MMWPLLLDYSRDECKRILRKLELEAYAAVVSAFRAQGDLTKDKKGILQELCSCLSISLERHRAEIRRSVNDEKLNTIADRMAGPNTSTEWAIEGRRLIPLMPRLVPQTAFTAIANNAANIQAAKNAAMPAPSATGLKEGDRQTISAISSSPQTPMRSPIQLMRPPSGPSPAPANSQHPVSPGSNNVLVLPSGMSIHIKGGEGSEDETNNNRKRKRSSSFDSIPGNPQKVVVTSNVLGHSGTVAGSNLPSPAARTTLAGTLTKSTATVTGPQGSKQVILLSGSNSNISPSILHRCLSVPVVKTVATTTNNVVASQTKATVSTTYSTISSPGTNTVAQPTFPVSGQSGMITTSATSGGSMVVYASARPRPKTVAVPRQVVRPRSSVMISPTSLGGTSPQFPSPRTQAPGIRPYVRTPVQYRQQDIGGGVKIITQSIPTSSSRLLPKPASNSLIVVTSAPSVAQQRQCTTMAGSGTISTPRIVNVMSVAPSQTRMPSRPQPVAGQVATTGKISPSPRHGAPSKPNVIVVHKAQTWPTPQNQGTAYVVSTANQYPRSSESVTYVQRQEKSKQGGMVTVVKTVAPPRTGSVVTTNSNAATVSSVPPAASAVAVAATTVAVVSEAATVTTSQSEISLAELQEAENHKNSLLADLIQAAGIVPESKAGATTNALSKPIQSVVATPRVPTPPPTTEVSSLDNTVVVERDIAGSPELLQLSEILAQSQSDSKDSAQELSLDTGVTIQDIEQLQLDQLQEGQVLEIQAQDASVLLNQSGQLTKEVLDLLQQAGIQIQQDDVQITTSVESPKSSEPQSKTSDESQEEQLAFLPDKVGEDTLIASTDNLPSIVEVFSTGLPTEFQTVHMVEDVVTSGEANNGPVVETPKTSATTTIPLQDLKQVPADPFHQQQEAETSKGNFLAESVLVETSELDTSAMKLEDFTSQRVDSEEFVGDSIEFNL